jgi:hypothetical protein
VLMIAVSFTHLHSHWAHVAWCTRPQAKKPKSFSRRSSIMALKAALAVTEVNLRLSELRGEAHQQPRGPGVGDGKVGGVLPQLHGEHVLRGGRHEERGARPRALQLRLHQERCTAAAASAKGKQSAA